MGEITRPQETFVNATRSGDAGNRLPGDSIKRKLAEMPSLSGSGVNYVKLLRGDRGVTVDLAAEVTHGSSNLMIGNGFDPDLSMLHTPDGDFFFSDQQGLVIKPVSQGFDDIGKQGLGGCQVWVADSEGLASKLGKITFGVPPIALKDGSGGEYDMTPSQALVFDFRSADEAQRPSRLDHQYNVYDEVIKKMFIYNEQHGHE